MAAKDDVEGVDKTIQGSCESFHIGHHFQTSAKDTPEVEEVEHVEKITWFVLALTSCVCLSGFLFGFDTGVISGALQPIRDEFQLNDVLSELIVGATTLGAIIGGLFAGFCSDRVGRKPITLLSSVVFVVGAIVIAAAPNFGVLIFGRLVVGFGVGLASMIVPVYLSEVAPRTLRGRLTTINVLMITFGQLVSYLINIAFAKTNEGWRYMFGIAAVPALIQLCILPFLPESPRQLVVKGRTEQATAALTKIYGKSVPEFFVQSELSQIEQSIEISKAGTYRELFKPYNRKPLIISCALQAAQQLSGFNCAMYYAATILHMAGFRDNSSSTYFSIVVSATNFLFTFIALTIIDKVGRRRILIYSMVAMIIGLWALGGAFAGQQGFMTLQDNCNYGTNCARCVQDSSCSWSISQGMCAITSGLDPADIFQSSTGCPPQAHDQALTGILFASLVVYVAGYALGLGNVPWLMQSELFPLSVRGKANGIATAVNWACNLIISTSFLSMTNGVSAAGTFWFYGGLSILFWIFALFEVPETANRSLEEVRRLFTKE
ncbi:hypothetical protein K450DRAFT_243384 [Umbelopsis ramanniana AG]|uniref:Major facilitator superfamily (MFS) profile domain-containing protein n=1 Tax=Umbelopsis ramanniana AG TaxID=1314678 RepID=A0AAD5HE63_UMBRA|nr:uncharacterized protein K450DRAFT_243384 [Umbelopsis ramanniana AG]KAI8579226.1 hypothetical protein K450DRAFT_243384 [Umbelopsis ramanniana AG]